MKIRPLNYPHIGFSYISLLNNKIYNIIDESDDGKDWKLLSNSNLNLLISKIHLLKALEDKVIRKL